MNSIQFNYFNIQNPFHRNKCSIEAMIFPLPTYFIYKNEFHIILKTVGQFMC